LPTAVVAVVPLAAAVVGFFALKETRRDRPPQKSGKSSDGSLFAREVLKPDVVHLLGCWCLLHWHDVAVMVAVPVWLFAPRASGGMGAGLDAIGAVIALRSALILVTHPLCYPPLDARFGERAMYLATSASRALSFLCYPLPAWTLPPTGPWPLATYAALGAALLLEAGGEAVFVSAESALSSVAPTPETVARVSTLAEMASRVVQFVATLAWPAIFAVCARQGGYFLGVLPGGAAFWLLPFACSLVHYAAVSRHSFAPGWRASERERLSTSSSTHGHS
jgi:hypothetical protein